jgi:hypothetical protein
MNVILGLGLLSSMFMLSCCCSCRSKKETSLTIAEKNSKLAFMLMLILLENKGENRKYIKMAEGIGYDHIIDTSEFIDTDSDSE